MATANIDRFFDVRKDDGEIYNRVSSHRVFIMDAESWTGMADQLTSIYSTGAASIFFNAGKLYAQRLTRTFQRTMERNESIKYLSDLATASGWGLFSLHIDHEFGKSSGKIIIDSKNFMMADRKKSEGPSCFFMKGLLQGAAEAVFGARFKG